MGKTTYIVVYNADYNVSLYSKTISEVTNIKYSGCLDWETERNVRITSNLDFWNIIVGTHALSSG